MIQSICQSRKFYIKTSSNILRKITSSQSIILKQSLSSTTAATWPDKRETSYSSSSPHKNSINNNNNNSNNNNHQPNQITKRKITGGFRAFSRTDSNSMNKPLYTSKNIPGNFTLSPRLRKSPFFDKTIEHGVGEFTIYNRMLMPLYYKEGLDTEYKALTEDVAIWDVAAERQVELRGPDAYKLAQFLTCRNISKIKPGKCVYAIMTDEDGVVINDPVLLKLADDRFWFSIADSDAVLWAKGIAIGQNLDVKVFEPDVSPLALQGPKSKDLMCDLYGADVVNKLKYFDFTRGEHTKLLGKIPTLLARSGWSPELGYEIYLEDSYYGNELYDLICEHGKKYNMKPGCPNHQRRIEGGMLSFGGDTLADTNALELGLPKKFVNPYSEHDFIGKEALQRIMEEDGGPARQLYGIMFNKSVEDDNLQNLIQYWQGKHLEVFEDNLAIAPIGTLTTFSPSSPKFDGHSLGFAFLDRMEHDHLNSTIYVKTANDVLVEGTVCKLPFAKRTA